MKISAIIAEYNPLHAGHVYHMQQTRARTHCDWLIVLMSGCFVQRGEPAIFDKWARARAALAAGADLVLELPVVSATGSAERFASGAVRILENLNCIDMLSFGSECADLALLQSTAQLLDEEPPAFRAQLAEGLAQGMGFAAARARAAGDARIQAVLSTPNCILALEYLKALRRQQSRIAPLAVARVGDCYHAARAQSAFPSATAVRNAMCEDLQEGLALLPPEVFPCFAGLQPVFVEQLFPLLLYRLRMLSAGQIAAFAEVAEGLENKLKQIAATAESYRALLQGVKSRRYTSTRIARIFLNCLLDVTAALRDELDDLPPYARVLGMRENARELLSLLSRTARIPLIMNPAGQTHPGLALDVRASDLYALLHTPPQPAGRDYTQRLLVV